MYDNASSGGYIDISLFGKWTLNITDGEISFTLYQRDVEAAPQCEFIFQFPQLNELEAIVETIAGQLSEISLAATPVLLLSQIGDIFCASSDGQEECFQSASKAFNLRSLKTHSP